MEVDCTECDNLYRGYPIKVVDMKYHNPFIEDPYHWESGFKCTWNGIESVEINDLPKGNCRCRGDYI